MTTTTTTTTHSSDLDELAAVIEHAKQHDLIDTISSVCTGQGVINPTVYVQGARAFLRWAKTTNATEVTQEMAGYFDAAGKRSDGQSITVSIGSYHSGGATPESLEVLLGLRCSSCSERLDDSAPTTPVGDLGEQIHDACAEHLVAP